MKYCLEYIWIDAKNELRSKTKVFDTFSNNNESPKLKDLPNWNYDGSSTNQATSEDSDVVLKPCAMFNDPFRKYNSYLVLCDTYTNDNKPLKTNNRYNANNIFNKKLEEYPWYGLEQEYFIIDPNVNKPLGFPQFGNPEEQGPYYCSIGVHNSFGRNIAEEHLESCIYAGIIISGINAEVCPGQWEFQIGPCEGIEAGDHLWVARYILVRIAEQYGYHIDFNPKPVKGEWNGSGCHTNYSTLNMRYGTDKLSGEKFIDDAIDKLSKNHKEHMEVYGDGNEERMTGKLETSSYDTFSHGISNRGASIRKGYNTVKDKNGYFEDRRPSSNCDPYLVTSKIFETTCLN